MRIGTILGTVTLSRQHEKLPAGRFLIVQPSSAEMLRGADGPSGESVVLYLLFPVRGYPAEYRTGRTAWSASAEYRFPLLLVDRGPGAWPLHVDRLSGSLFADAGNAWGPELGIPGYDNPRRGVLASVGGELQLRVLPFWTFTWVVRFGVARPLRELRGTVGYVRLGLSF